MATNMKHCLLLLSMVLIILIGLGLVSATDTSNTTQVVKDNNVLSTPSNYDVDNVVQSDLANVKSDADVEKISDTSENTNTITTNKQTAISNKTRNDNIIKNNINDDIEKTIKGDGEGTFIELQELINGNSVINLDKNYKFTPGVDDQEGFSLTDGIVIDHDITINGENYALDGSNLSRIFYIGESITVNINKVVFKNGMTTANGSAIYTLSTINVDNCTFANNTGNASGAVWISNFATNTQILNSTFINNTAKGYNTTSNGRTYYYGDGGALYFNGESINALIHNTTFINNSANANGGAILLNATYSNITSSCFYNNSAPYAAGAVRLDGKYLVVNDSLFDGNYDPIGNYSWGSAIYLTGNYTNITNSNFTNQHGANTGGAVAIDGSNELLENITFINNTAYNGGAIFIQKNENVTFNNSNFINNTAIINGGAINIDAYANDTRILNSNFTNNKVTGINNNGWLYGEGGAINFGQGCSNGIIENSSFTNNTALAKAGAVNWNGADGQIISSNFTNNSASLDGGAVLFTGNKGYINTSIFKNNTSNYAGGALRISGNNTTVNNTLFDGNYDPQNKAWGSAIYLSGHNAMIDYSNFTNNYGSVSAGAVYVAGANATVSNSQFVNNNASSDAGAVLLNGTNGSIVNSNFTNGAAGHEGGAVYINGSFANITNSHFIQNNAKVNAGAIYIRGNNATIIESNITGNIVTAGYGGAVYVSGNNATISYTNFSRNNASSDGGAIYIKGTKATFEYCNMTNNWAQGKGGVIYNNGVNASILYSNFDSNYARNDGGCMDLTGSSNSVIIGCNFTNGTTNEHGGAISATSSNNLTIQSSRFANCSNGNTHGGAIYLEGNSVDSNLLVDNCTFINDTSGKDAGAIYFQNQNGRNSTLSNCTFINCTTLTRSPGAVCWRENNGLIINNVFINCTAMSMDSVDYSGQGGAMYLENAVNNVLINDTFINCSAIWDGGAIFYRANSKNNTHINCTFINNTAGRNGGALYFKNANNTYDGCVFINNTAVNGGSIYYSVDDPIIMRNCVFENTSDVTEGGFIYVNGKNLNIDNTTFRNGLAERGGALYITKDVTITNSNITNNNATTGSAIYIKSGTVRLTNVNLLENQAHSKEFANTYNYVENGERVIGGQFTGYDNLLNGIYREAGNVICVNVKYLGVDGIVNSDDTQDTMRITINEIYQKVIIEVYDKDNNLFYEAINMTDKDGKYEFRFTDSEDYSYRLYHPEDEYYTYLVYALNKMIVNMTVTASNITYGESESIQIKISSDTDVVPTGRVTVYVNSTLEGFENCTYVRTLDDTGIIIIDDAPLNLLNASSYNVSVNYTGDINYFSEQANTTFNVSKKATIVDFDVEDYTYNQTRSIDFSLTDIDDTQLSGKVLLNITGALFNGTRVSINDIPLNIEVGPGGQTGNTYDLPILDAGNYELTAFYNETANYYQNTTVKRFTVNKANPTVNVTAKANEDEIFGIYVHVEPEISTNRVTITITNETGIVDQFILALDDSKAYKILDVLPVGHYDVSAYYLGDNNHYELTNTTSFDVTIENYPIAIQLRNMTYGQTQIIKVTVPKDGEVDNLSIKLNGEDIAFTMDEDGLIQIDTQSLTDIVPDGKLVVGEYNLTVSYTTDGHYRSNSSSMLFNVTKADPTVNLQTSSISYGDNETVKVTINSYNATGNITVKLINSLDAVIDTREFNINSNTPVEFNYTELEPGTYRVNVSYVNDTNYNDSNVTSEFTVRTQQITINELSNIYVGESQRIWGIVTDGYGLAVTKGSVNITLSNGTNITCSLDSSGVYSSEPIFTNNGTYIVSASYIYNDIIRTTSVERSFDVSKIPTITTVKILNNTVRHVAIDVIVQENVPGKYTGYVHNGVINVTIPGINDGNTVGYPIQGINTTIPLNDITWVGTVPATVVYNGSSKYASSTGLNITDTSQIFDHIDVEAIASNVTITVVPNPVISGSAVTITGRVYDESGFEITEGTVNIKVGDITYSNVEVGSNGYSQEYVTSIVGQIPVEVHFNGIKDGQSRDVVLESTNNTTFTVEVNKHKTNLTIVPFNGVEINKTFTITLNLTNRTGDAIVGKHINVLINKQPVTVTGVTGNDGLLTFDYVVHDSNLIIVEAEFVEDDEYLGNSTFWVYTGVIPLLTANISVDVDHNPIFINDTLVISGSLNDSFTNETYPNEYAHPIGGAQVNININGTIITTNTDENGRYTVALTKDTYPQLLAYSSDNYVITAEYAGQAGVILGKAASTTYKVEKIYTNLTIDPISNVAINQSFTVTINLTNRTGSPISDKDVYVQVNGIPVENLGKTNTQGQLTFEYTVHNNSEFIIEAVFEEDDIYYANSTVLQYTDKIELLNSTISVNVNKSQIIVNETIKISGTLNSSFFNTTTGKYNPIAGVDVLIRIDSADVKTVQTDDAGYYEYILTTDEYEYLQNSQTPYNVTAIFAGISGVISGDTESTSYIVSKIATKTNITILNSTSGNVTLAINVTNETGSLIPSGHVIVTNATDGSILGEGNLTDGKVNITLNDVTEPGDIAFNVTFEGNDNYLPSNATGINPPEGMANTTVITVTIASNITINLDKDEVIIGETVRISGTVYNETGQPLCEDANVIVSIENQDYEATFNPLDGTYYYDYTPEHNGTITINASYIKDNQKEATSNSLNLTVNKIPTTVTITDITNVEVNKTFTIEVTLTNKTGEAITDKQISITVNGVEQENIPLTDSTGKISITFTPHNNTDLEIKAVYNGSEVYLASEDSTVVDVALSQSTLTVNVNKSALYAGESVNITGILVDGQGNDLADATVTIYVNGNRLTSLITNSTGGYSHPVSHLTEGEYTVQAVFEGVANAIIGDDDTTYYSVHKMPTDLTLTIPEAAEVYVPFNIEVTLNNKTENTNAIEGKSITITVNDVPIKSVPLTDYNGKVVVSYTPQNNSTLVIKAIFDGDDYYVNSDDTGRINDISLSQSIITVNVNKSSLNTSESVNITGKLVDGQNNDITGAVVKLYINDELEAIVLTNSTGEYSYVIDQLAKGQYTVKAVYAGEENSIKGDDDTTSYVVDKMNTTLTLTVPEKASVNVPFDIEVTLNNKIANTNPISGKTVIVTVNDEIIATLTTDNEGKTTVKYTPLNNSTLIIKAVFAEDDYYYGNESVKTIEARNISLSQSSINVSVNKSSLYASEGINITGRLVDGQDNIIRGADVKIYINDELVATVQTNLTGEYSYAIDDLHKGDYSVKAVYDGVENVINGSFNTTEFTVDKMPTTVTVNIPENAEVLKAFDIEVTLTNSTSNNNAISGKFIKITVNDMVIATSLTDENGKIVVSYTPQDNTELTIKAVFNEDGYYYGDDDEKTIATEDIALSQSIITVSVNETTVGLGNYVRILGQLTDAQGEPIKQADITIIIYDEENNPVSVILHVKTDSEGYFAAVQDNHKVGKFTVNATYHGHPYAILPSSDTCTYEVIDYSITVNVDRPEIYVDEYVTVYGSVFDGLGQLIENGLVHIVISNSTGVYSEGDYAIVDGIYTANAKYPAGGKYNVTATYTISDTQNVTNGTAKFNVSKIPTITNVTVINNTVGNVIIDVIVSENVPGEYTNVITNGTINVQVADGDVLTYPITSSNTTINLDIDTTDVVSVSVVYPTTYKYEESTGINNTTGEAFDSIKANAAGSMITVSVEDNPAVYTDNVIIRGVVYDEFGNVIGLGNVTITVDGKDSITIPFTGGKYSYTYPTDRISDNIQVNVEYTGAYTGEGNLLIESSTNDTTFNVTKIPTLVTIGDISDVEVNKEFTIIVTLTNTTGSPIEGKEVTIAVNDVALENIPTTDSSGKTSITFTPHNNTDLEIKAVYNGNEVCLASEDSTVVDVALSQSTLTVMVDKAAIYAGENVNISGKLIDGQSNKLVDQPVTIYVNGNRITTVLTDNNGEYSYVMTHQAAGEYTVQAVYGGIVNAIIGDDDTTYYSVHKMPTNVTVTLPSEVEVYVPFNIEVTLANNTANTNAISGKPITITVNGEVLTHVPLTDIDGKIVVSYTPQNNSTIVVRAVFEEDDYYLESSDIERIASENIKLSNSTITVNVNESSLYVDESVEITGRLTDGLNRSISTADVKIYINDELFTTVETNRNGEYSYIINNLNKGNYSVRVVYEGLENSITSSSNNTSYNVSKIPTITTVSVINNTQSNVTIDVVITENVPGRHTNIVSAGSFEVTVNGKVQQYPVKGRNSTIVLDGNAFINTTDEVIFNVKYVENDKYFSSNGLNSSTGEEITTFNADSQQSSITVIATPETQTTGQTVTISGHVYDGMGNEITEGTVYISINEEEPVRASLTTDGYSYPYEADIAGINNVTVVFEDVLTENSNVLIKSSTNNTTFVVDKIKTTTTVEILNNTVGNVTIDIKVVGADGNNTLTGDVNITIAGKNHTVSLIEGKSNLTVELSEITQPGDIPVSVEYLGNDYYAPSIANNTEDNKELTNITVEKQDVNITLTTNVTNCYIGEIVNISGNLTDGMGQRIADAIVTITVDGNKYIVQTDRAGEYSLDYKSDKLGEIPVNVTFAGDNYNDTSANATFNVTKIPTTTSADIINTTLSNVTVEVKVVDVYGEAINGTVKVRNASDYTQVLAESQVTDGVVNITIPSEIGSLEVIIEYQENDIDLASNATGNVDPETNITVIDVTRIPTITNVEILNTTLSNVTIKVTVTNQTNNPVANGSVSILDENGNVIDDLTINLENGEATIKLPFNEAKDYKVIVHYNENNVYMASNATNSSEEGSPDENITIITVEKIPTKTNVTILDTTFNNVTIHVNVTNMTNVNVEDGTITIFDREGNILVDNYPLTDGQADIKIPVEKTGELLVIVHYNENNIYMPSNATNTSSLGALEEITFINVTKIPTITNVEIVSNLINNVTLSVNVTNTSTSELVEKGQVAVYDTSGKELARSDLTGGKADIILPRSVDGIFEVVVKYVENDIYYNSTALNESAVAGRENITVINVTKIATKTTVEILNKTIGNVTLHISTTNMTDDNVTKGHVVVRDQNNNILGEGELVNGGIDLTLNVTTPTLIGVNVTYNENDVYYSSNARNNTLPSPSPDENITYIDVAKQNATITISINKDVVVIGEDVTISGVVKDGMGMPITEGTVNVNINDTIYPVEIKDGLYTLTNITIAAGVYTVNATYAGCENISSITSENVEFKVNKIPTTTTVKILNNTAGNVTIEVTVTNATGELVNTGNVVVKDADGTIVTGSLTDGKIVLIIPTENTDTLYVNVSYVENTHYYPSNATNTSSTTPQDENITVIDLVKQNATITIEVVNPSVIMGDNVTICGQVFDGMGNLITTGDVDVTVDGQVISTTIVDGYYTIKNQTYTAGTYEVNATYKGNATVASVISETANFTVSKMPTVTVVEVLNNTAGNVTIDVVVTNSTGESVTSGKFNVTVAGNTVTVDVAGANTTVKLNITDAGDVAVKVTYLENDNYTSSDAIDKATIPEGGSPLDGDVLDNITVVLQNATITVNATPHDAIVYQDVTINGTLTDGMDSPIANAYVEITVNDTSIITKTNSEGIYSIVYTPLYNGTVDVKAVYVGNSTVDKVENTTSFTVDKIATITNVNITNTTLSNVTIKVNVTNTTGDVVTKGSIVIYDTNLNELAKANLTDGMTEIQVPTDTIEPLEVIVKYIENDLYLNSTALNDTAEPGRENITLIDVTRIPTQTSVEILDNIAGNVTLAVNVTNMTGNAVTEGVVYVHNASNYDDILGTGNITDGIAVIKLDSVLESGLIEVVVEYQENNIYMPSNATNSSAIDTPRENITVIDVQKQSVTITIELSNSSIIISESTVISGQVFDGMGEVVKAGNVTVYVTDEDSTTSEKTVEIVDDKYTLTYIGIKAGNYTVKAKYLGNASMTAVMSEELTFTVNKISTQTNVSILNTTLSNVTISVNVTNITDALVTKGTITVKDTTGKVLNETTLNGGMANITIPVDSIGQLRVIVTYNENNIYASSNATNSSAIGTPDEEIIIIDVTRIPTITTVEIVNTILNNVTIDVSVTNITRRPITTGTIVVTDTTGKILANGELSDSHITLSLPATSAGEMEVIVTYQENEVYLASNATNASAAEARENITVINVTKLPTITNVEIINTTLGNVTIGVNVTNMTESLVDRGYVVVYDIDDNILVNQTPLVNGRTNITLPVTKGGQLDIRVEYQENDYYYASNATNSSADPSKQNITVINVTKMPTITTVDIINHTAGNVTVKVTVTNMTNDVVTEGKVHIKDNATGNILAEATLTNGVSNITIPVSNTDTLYVIVEYQENDYYYGSNATNSSATPGDENITVIAVVKQNATVTIELNNNSIIIGDKVVISGVVKDELGNVITEGQVSLDIDGFQETVDIAESKYTLDYTPANIDNYTVKATYLGNEMVNEAISQTLNFTVGKIPTKTNVTIINTTVGNVTIGVNATNLTDEKVIKGNITVYDMNGNELVNNTLTDGLANITIPVEHDGQISVIVTYNENDLYLSSNATNSSASGTPSEQIIVIDVVAQESNITIDTDKDTATIGENVTITGTVTDGMGNPITNGTVTIDVNGEKHSVNVTDGEYSLDYTITKAGKLPITATYNGEEGVIKASTSETVELTANKKETQISATQVGNTPANTSIVVNVTDDEGNPVNEGNVIVTLPDGTSVTAPVVEGKAVIPINTTPGKANVTVVYNGTGVYDKQATNLTTTTVKLNTTIPIDKINNVTIGDNITIHGSLSDQNGVDITNANITVTINGKKYNTTTNKAGEYTLTYTTTTSGINNITVEYAGNTIYNPTNNKTNFTVNKKDIVLDVKQTNNSAGNTSIEVKVTDDEGRPVNEGNVIVTMPNGTNVTVPVVNGTAVVPLNTTPGSIKVNITYNGTDKYNKQNCTSTVTTLKINTTIPINTIKTVSVGDKINITGKLLDSNNKTITNANITVKVNGKSYNTTTNNKGAYTLPYTTTTSGQNNVTVSYAGNKTYNPTNNQTNFTVKVNSTVKSKQTGSNVGNTTIQVNITDKNGNKIQNGTVIVKDKDGKIIGTTVVKNGTATVKLDVPEGKQNITVTYNGNELVNPSTITQSISVNKNKAILTINTIKNITLTQKAQISGKLTDINGNPIANAKVVLNMDGVNKTVTTDRYGDYTLEYNTTYVGLNNVTAQFNGDNVYKSAKANSTYNASKIITYVTVDDVRGVLGDNITLRATVTDEFGTKVTGGQFVFKVNGLTLRTNGKFEANGTPMILSPVNGTVTVTVVADTYLRSAVNITGAYGGNSKYYSSRSIVAGRASLVKRDAQITVTTVKTTKQDVKITLKAVVTDITGGKNNGRVRDYEDNFVVFKVNGITIKNEDGTAKQAKVVNGVATMEYYVPAGLAGKYTNLTDKAYTVMAVFGSGSYNPGVQNTTTFGVERSAISFVNTTVTLNSQSKEMTVKSKIVDYHNNLLKGTNTLCLKINGQTYKINNKTVFFNAVDGDVDINMIVPYNVNKINSVELVTGERVGYLGGRCTTTDIIRV